MSLLQSLRTLSVGTLLLAAPVAAQPAPLPGLTLREGAASATLTVENDASSGAFGSIASLAPDLAIGITDDVTLSLIHSTFGRTGFRGVAGSGLCVTEACAHTYDNVGVEALYSLRRGALSIAANGGVHATTFDRGHYVAKLGAKLRYKIGKAVVTSLPSVALAISQRENPMPNRDRLWVPLSATYPLVDGLAVGVATGFKGPIDDLRNSYEIAAGVLATYAYSPAIGGGISWIHGKLAGGEMALPSDAQGRDSRAIHLWISATR